MHRNLLFAFFGSFAPTLSAPSVLNYNIGIMIIEWSCNHRPCNNLMKLIIKMVFKRTSCIYRFPIFLGFLCFHIAVNNQGTVLVCFHLTLQHKTQIWSTMASKEDTTAKWKEYMLSHNDSMVTPHKHTWFRITLLFCTDALKGLQKGQWSSDQISADEPQGIWPLKKLNWIMRSNAVFQSWLNAPWTVLKIAWFSIPCLI